MRRPMWKIHCLTVLLLTGINIYLLIKLLRCAERKAAVETAYNATISGASTSAAGKNDHAQHGSSYYDQQRGGDVQIRRPAWKNLQLTVTSQQHVVENSFVLAPESSSSSSSSSAPLDRGKGPTGRFLNSAAAGQDRSSEQESLSDDLLTLGRWDDSRRFLIRDFALAGRQFHATAVNHNVCLATQSSLDRLRWLSEVADHWRGAMSVAVFLDDDEVAIFHRLVRHLQRCHSDLLSNVAFHVVSAGIQTPSSTSTSSASAASANTASSSSALPLYSSKAWTEATSIGVSNTDPDGALSNCTSPSEALSWLLKERPSLATEWETGRSYPQNLMRNVARKGCPSQYVMLLDVDVIPVYNMAEAVAEFLDRPEVAHCTKCAFVVPTYELDYSAEFPQNKSQLLGLEIRGKAQPFHQKAFRYNQFASNLTRWRQTGETDQVVISHNVTNYEFFYEPFYIARDEAPPHDERFVGYGFTRNTQVYEMALSGWTFHVLSPIFTIHWGLQMKQRRPGWRKAQMDRNRRLFDVIHHELKAKYGLLNKNAGIRWHPAKPLAGQQQQKSPSQQQQQQSGKSEQQGNEQRASD